MFSQFALDVAFNRQGLLLNCSEGCRLRLALKVEDIYPNPGEVLQNFGVEGDRFPKLALPIQATAARNCSNEIVYSIYIIRHTLSRLDEATPTDVGLSQRTNCCVPSPDAVILFPAFCQAFQHARRCCHPRTLPTYLQKARLIQLTSCKTCFTFG